MKTRILSLVGAVAMAAGFTSCHSYGPNTKAGAAIGGLGGAALGGIIGHQSGHALEGAAIGAAGGAAAGGLIGSSMDDREAAYYGRPARRGYYHGY